MHMDSILISTRDRVLDGLRDMLESAIGQHEYVFSYVELPVALLIIEAAKRAEDKDEWFPHGKWAMIQSIQSSIDKETGEFFNVHNAKLSRALDARNNTAGVDSVGLK